MEPGESSIGNTPALLEAFDDVVFDIAQERDILSEDGQVIRCGRPRQVCRVFRGQLVADALRINADDARGDHRPEPFADIALVEAGPSGNLSRSEWRLILHGVEEAGAVTDGGHQAERSIVKGIQNAAGKCRRLLSIE